MKEYSKIQTVFLRNPDDKFKTLLIGQFALPEFEYLSNAIWEYTEKVDGTNIRIIWTNSKFIFRGKSEKSDIPGQLIENLDNKFSILKDKFSELFKDNNVCLYGEGYGGYIQKAGKSYRSDCGFVLFDVKIGDWWLQRKDVEDIAETFGIDIIPVIGKGTLWDMVDIVKKGFRSKWNKDFIAEGIVARPKTELKTRRGDRIITKLKYKDFN